MALTALNKRMWLQLPLIIIIVFVFIGIFYLLQPGRGRIYPKNGCLDLRDWNLGQHIGLNGEWDFYWKKLLTYPELKRNSVPDLRVKAPAAWNNYRIRGKRLPGFGYATYRLHVFNIPKGTPLALRVPTLSAAYKLYINNQLVAANGKVATSKKKFTPQYLPEIVEFTPDGDNFEIIIQVANFVSARGGMWYRLVMGTPEEIRNSYRNTANLDLLLIGALMVMAFYYLGIFLLRPEDKSSFYFALICLIFVSRTAVFGDYFLYRLNPAIGYQAINGITWTMLVWFPIIAVLFVDQLFPKETSKKVRQAILVYGLLMAVMFLLFPISFYTHFVLLVQFIEITTYLYAILCLVKAFLNRQKGALLMLIGSLGIIICASRVMVYQQNIILSNYGYLVQDGLFALLLLQSFILARRFSTAYHDVQALSEKLLKLDKIKDEFLANTSHELRTPLNGILGIAEATLRGSEGELTGGQKQNLSMVIASGRRLANLVNDILDYSKLKYGDMRLNIQPVRVDGLIRTVVNVFQQLSKSKKYQVILELPGELPPVLADEHRVLQILYNLVGNASKFTTHGYIKVSTKVTGTMLEICVSDTGEGIPGDKLEDIFKSYEQLDTSLTRKNSGTGLGLFITKQLVEIQGGRIRVESVLEKGSAFYFTLPMTTAIPVEKELNTALLEMTAAATLEPPVPFGKAGTGVGILLVDDDAVNLQSLGSILKIGGYGVTTVNNGNAALEEIRRNREYSLVILDVMMPEISGYEVCRKLRENKSHFDLPVLMLTAKTTTEDIVTGFEAGANDYLPKPFEPEELLARVKTLVNLKNSVDKAMAAEVAFMQAQIKPHYLFNTLNTISSFCDTDPEQARQLIDEFANYLRQSFDFKNLEMYVPLAREISLIKSYTEIEKARFGDTLKVEFFMDEIPDLKIPPLSIQPLVENAIRHGIRKKSGGGTVSVTIKNTEDGVLVTVADNGSGIPQDMLANILKAEASQGIGLWNIDFRLRKLFGKGLIIESESGKGTRVMFVIPPERSRSF